MEDAIDGVIRADLQGVVAPLDFMAMRRSPIPTITTRRRACGPQRADDRITGHSIIIVAVFPPFPWIQAFPGTHAIVATLTRTYWCRRGTVAALGWPVLT